MQIIGYNFSHPDQLSRALSAASQLIHGKDRAGSVEALEFVGCLFTDAEQVRVLPRKFIDLRRVTIHNCLRFDLDWAVITNHSEFRRNLHFSVPIRRQVDHFGVPGITTTGQYYLNPVDPALAFAQWIYQNAINGPGESILLSQPAMLRHVLYYLNFDSVETDTYEGTDGSIRLVPDMPLKSSTPEDVLDALRGVNAERFIANVVRRWQPQTSRMPRKEYDKHPAVILKECEACPRNEDDVIGNFTCGSGDDEDRDDSDSETEASKVSHRGVFWSDTARHKDDAPCALYLATNACKKHLNDMSDLIDGMIIDTQARNITFALLPPAHNGAEMWEQLLNSLLRLSDPVKVDIRGNRWID